MPAAAAKANAAVAFICGEDEFAVKQRARQLYRQWCAESGGFDHETIDASAANGGEALSALRKLREALQTLPFFGGAKVVWFADCNFLGEERAAQSEAVTSALADLAQELKAFKWEGVRLVISAGKVDKRKLFFKSLDKLGTVEIFDAWSAADKEWAAHFGLTARKAIEDRQKQIAEAALDDLVHRVGPHARQLQAEIEKLCLYVGDRSEIGKTDVESVCLRNRTAVAFAVGDALGDRNLPKLLQRLDEELWEIRSKLDKNKSIIGLLYGLISKVRAMLLLKAMIAEGWIKPGSDYSHFKSQLERVPADQFPEDRKYNPLTMHPYMLHRALVQAGNYSSEELVQAMDVLLRCNQRLVSSGLDDTLVLQQALVQIVGANTGSPRAAAAPAGR